MRATLSPHCSSTSHPTDHILAEFRTSLTCEARPTGWGIDDMWEYAFYALYGRVAAERTGRPVEDVASALAEVGAST